MKANPEWNALQALIEGELKMERTLVFLKPDCLQRELVGEVIGRIERKGLKIVGMKMMRPSKEFFRTHYGHLAGKPFYPRIEAFMASAPVIAIAVEGFNAVEDMRKLAGVTKAYEAEAGTIRGDLANSIQCNVIHASDSKETAEKELGRFFKKDELVEWRQNNYDFLYSGEEK